MTVSYSRNAVVEWDHNLGKFIVYRSFVCVWMRPGRTPVEIQVEEDFETDFASIPRWARSIVPVVGRHIQPAIVHDWTYEHVVPDMPDMSNKQADLLFLEGMEHFKVIWPRRRILYRATRLGGTGRWS